MRCRADHLVDSVMSTDVFPSSKQAPFHVEQTCGVKATGGIESRLVLPQTGSEGGGNALLDGPVLNGPQEKANLFD